MFKVVILSLSKLVARMYKYLSRCTLRMTWSFKSCSTVAHLHIKPGIVSEGLLHYCAGVHLAGFNLWQLVALLYWCTSSMTQSLKAYCTGVHPEHDPISESLLCRCTSSMSQSESLLYKCASRMTQSQSVCCAGVHLEQDSV